MKNILPVYVAAQSGDAITTYIGLSSGVAEEANSLALALVSSPITMTLAKLIGGITLAFMISKLNNPSKRRWTFKLVTAGYVGVVINNLLVINGII